MFGPARPISPAEMSVITPEASTPESATESEPARTPLGEDQLRELVASLGDLPSLPDIALRAMRLAEDPDWDLKKLEQTIRRDQGLAARFLRLANSAFFGARCTITTLDRAINLVGITRVQSVLLAAGLEGLHQSKKSNFKGRILWEHALAVACMSQYLAKQSGIGDPEEAFMAGLLHDIGRPIMDDVFPRQVWRGHCTGRGRVGRIVAQRRAADLQVRPHRCRIRRRVGLGISAAYW